MSRRTELTLPTVPSPKGFGIRFVSRGMLAALISLSLSDMTITVSVLVMVLSRASMPRSRSVSLPSLPQLMAGGSSTGGSGMGDQVIGRPIAPPSPISWTKNVRRPRVSARPSMGAAAAKTLVVGMSMVRAKSQSDCDSSMWAHECPSDPGWSSARAQRGLARTLLRLSAAARLACRCGVPCQDHRHGRTEGITRT